jgi:sugar phosphate isomerase/epimerase
MHVQMRRCTTGRDLMRLRHRSGRLVHLSSGIDVHGTRDLPAVVERIDAYATEVRGRLDAGVLAVSLWLPPTLAAALAVDGRLRTRLRGELDARGLEVVTLSGMPYAGGGGENPVEEPDWSDPDRLEYTLDLARVLVDLLPDDAVRGAVTTIGLGRRAGWDDAKEKACGRVLGRLSAGLAEVAWHTGRAVRVGLQPEPGNVLDATDQTIAALAGVGKERIGICLDLANLACTWEDPADALDRLTRAGLSVIQVRIAAAVEVPAPLAAADTLRGYLPAGARCPITNAGGAYLDEMPASADDFPPGPWRVRRHVPLAEVPPAPLTATTDVWRAALRHLMGGAQPGTECLDVHAAPRGETPPDRPAGAPAPADSIASELAYASNELANLGLTPPAQARAA